MGLLQRIFGGSKEEEDVGPPPECTHASLVARWDNPDDIGKEDKATEWVCTSCNDSFTPAERTQIEATEADRVRQIQQDNAAHKAELDRQQAEAAAKKK